MSNDKLKDAHSGSTECRAKSKHAAGVAARLRSSAAARRLVVIDGKVEVLGEAAERLGIEPQRLSRWYREGCWTTEAILGRARRST
jgi:hypothetical protein